MSVRNPGTLIGVGFVLVVLGVVVPLLMVLGLLGKSLALSFLSFAASVTGLFLGVIGSALYVRIRKG
jgi:hypothetical protein